jgi:hypothetical protein
VDKTTLKYERFLVFCLKEYVKNKNGISRLKSSPIITKEYYSVGPDIFNWIMSDKEFQDYFGFPLSEIKILRHSLHEDSILLIEFINQKDEVFFGWPILVENLLTEINDEWAMKERLARPKYFDDDLPF